MSAKFNRGKPYHGSNAVTDGKLKGETDTDYFYFFCPQCGDRHVMRPLDYALHVETDKNKYDHQTKSTAAKGFTLVFNLYCEKCGLKDFVKISNLGWQGGQLPAAK